MLHKQPTSPLCYRLGSLYRSNGLENPDPNMLILVSTHNSIRLNGSCACAGPVRIWLSISTQRVFFAVRDWELYILAVVRRIAPFFLPVHL